MGQFVGMESFNEILTSLLPSAVMITFVLISTLLLVSVLQPIFKKALSSFLSAYEAQYSWIFIKYAIWIAALLILTFILVGDTLGLTVFMVLFLLIIVLMSYKALINFSGWLFIIFHHQIKLGDYAELNGIKGKIVGITMMNTIMEERGEYMGLKPKTRRKVMIPNSFIFSSPIFTTSAKESMIWDEIKIMLSANTDHLLARDIITQVANSVVGPIMRKHSQEMINHNPSKKDTPSHPVTTISIEPEGVRITLTYFCLSSDNAKVRSTISENILSEFNKEGIEVAFQNP
jgi:small-conductance mechanosensitive channel